MSCTLDDQLLRWYAHYQELLKEEHPEKHYKWTKTNQQEKILKTKTYEKWQELKK